MPYTSKVVGVSSSPLAFFAGSVFWRRFRLSSRHVRRLSPLWSFAQVQAWAEDAAAANDADSKIKHLDANGARLAGGDTVTLIKDLNVKGANFIAKRGTAVRNISPVADNPQQIEGRVNGQQIVILTEFVKKSN